LPSGFNERTGISFVTVAIACQFGLPELQARFWETRKTALKVWMTMPKAPMHEDNFLQLLKNQVGCAGQVLAM